MKLTKTFFNFGGNKTEALFKRSNLKRLVQLLFLILLFMQVFELPLEAEVDYIKQMGLTRPEKAAAAPNFVLPDLNGKKIGLSRYHGKFVMLNFWATW